MNLNAYVAQKKREIFDALFAGQPPTEGEFDEQLWRDGKAKGQPQMGSSTFRPNQITLEYIYSDPNGAAVVLPVKLVPPERIVYMPVPGWVVENIWQGDVAGSYHFESDAQRLSETFVQSLTAAENANLFEPQAAKRRE